MTIEITVCIPFLLYTEERQEASTGTRLPMVERYNGAKQNTITTH